jgi:Transposase DDE domain group 1
VLHTAAYWLLHTLRGLAPKRSFWRDAQLDTLRLVLIEVAARVTELATRIKVALPSSHPERDSLVLLAAGPRGRPEPRGGVPRPEPVPRNHQPRSPRRRRHGLLRPPPPRAGHVTTPVNDPGY